MAVPVESPLAFFQKPVKTALRDPVEATQVPFGLVPEVLDAVDVMVSFRHERRAVTDTPVMELRHIQDIIIKGVTSWNMTKLW